MLSHIYYFPFILKMEFIELIYLIFISSPALDITFHDVTLSLFLYLLGIGSISAEDI